jgi:hypothetical protein
MASRGRVLKDMTVGGKNVKSIRLYRLALFASLALNALLVTAFWLYVHFAGTLSMIEDAVGFFN